MAKLEAIVGLARVLGPVVTWLFFDQDISPPLGEISNPITRSPGPTSIIFEDLVNESLPI
jgi:hypothetical protein